VGDASVQNPQIPEEPPEDDEDQNRKSNRPTPPTESYGMALKESVLHRVRCRSNRVHTTSLVDLRHQRILLIRELNLRPLNRARQADSGQCFDAVIGLVHEHAPHKNLRSTDLGRAH